MIVTVQCVPARLEFIKERLKSWKKPTPIYHVDHNYTGSFNAFAEMLNIPFDQYRLHLQDDLIIANDLGENLDYLEDLVRENNIDVLSLYANPRKSIERDFKAGHRISELKPFLMLQACVFSRRFVDIMRSEVDNFRNEKADDVFVRDVIKKHKIKAYCHLPALVQHNIYMESFEGHQPNKNRMTTIFDNNFFKQ